MNAVGPSVPVFRCKSLREGKFFIVHACDSKFETFQLAEFVMKIIVALHAELPRTAHLRELIVAAKH